MGNIVGKQIIEEAIEELLYSNEGVIVPGLGCFAKQYKPAGFDYVQGKISPPSTTLTFNENLILDDGVLVDFFLKKTGLPLDVTKQHISNYTKHCKETLSRKEVLSIPKVGRLLKDYEMKTKFISDNHNFNTDTFGLPEISYYPIMRNLPKQEEKAVEQNQTSAIPQAKSTGKSTNNLLRIGAPIALAFIVVATVFFIYNNNNKSNGIASNGVDEASKLPVNISPVDNIEDDIYVDGEDLDYNNTGTTEDETIDNASVAVDEEETIYEPETEEPVEHINPITKNNFRVIYVGLFAKQDGVDRTTAKIVENDFIPYTEINSKGLTKVGVKVMEGESANEILHKVQATIEKTAYLK